MFKKLQQLLITETGKDTTVVFLGTFVNAVIGALVFTLLPRILGSFNYGLFSTVLATEVLVVRLTSLGVDSGIFKFAHKNSRNANSILSIAFKSYLLIGFLVAVIGYLISPTVAKALNQPQITSLLRLAFATTIFFHLTNLFFVGLQAKQQFFKSYLPLIANNIARLIFIVIGSLFFVMNLYQLTFIYFIVTIISTILGRYFLPIKLVPIDKQLSKAFYKFNIWVALAFGIASIPLDNYFLLKIAGPVQTGLYAAPLKIMTFTQDFGGSISRVLATRFVSFNSHQKAIEFTKKLSPLILFFTFGFLALIVLAKPVTLILFGNEFIGSISVLQILSVGLIFFFATTIPSAIILYYFGASSVTFFITLARATVFLILLFLLVRPYQAVGAAYAFVLTEIFTFLTSSIYCFIKLKKHD